MAEDIIKERNDDAGHEFRVGQSYVMYPYIDTVTNSLYLLAHWIKSSGGGTSGGGDTAVPGVINVGAVSGGGSSNTSNNKKQKVDPLTGAVALTDVQWYRDEFGRWHGSSQALGGSLSGWQYIDYEDNANWYMFENTGTMLSGWVATNEKYYYLQEVTDGNRVAGAMVADGWDSINGIQYFFGPDGSCLTPEFINPFSVQLYDPATKFYVPSVDMLQDNSVQELLIQQQLIEAQRAQQLAQQQAVSNIINNLQNVTPTDQLPEQVVVGQITEDPVVNKALDGYVMGPTVVANSQQGSVVANWEFSEDGSTQKLMLTNINGVPMENNTQFATDGWYVVNGTNWYMFDDKGDMVTGLYNDNQGNTYYLAEDTELKGTMQTGWVTVNGYEYYFVEQGFDSFGVYGTMLKGTKAPDGSELGPDGKRLTGR